MRIRSTKPEFWSSRTVCEVEWEHRLVLKGLESYVDDNGVGKDDLELICGDVWKRDLAREGSRTLARVSEALTHLHEAGLIWRYEVEGEHLLYVSCWESIQKIDKPSAGRFPRPDGTLHYKESQIRECVASHREPSRALATGTGEQGNRGTGEQTSSSEIASDPDPSLDDVDEHPRPEVVELCNYLAERARENGHTATIGKRWYRACRLLIDRDGHAADQVRKAIDWATADPFWSTNIQSMQKLREKYSQMQGQAKLRPNNANQPKPAPSYVPSYHGDADDLDAYQRWYATDHADPAAVAEYHSWYGVRHPEAS